MTFCPGVPRAADACTCSGNLTRVDERTERQSVTGETTRRSRVLRASPWLVILVLIGSVQWFRGQPFDTTLFLVAAAVLLIDAFGYLRWRVRSPRATHGVVIAVVAVIGVVLLTAPRHGVLDGVTLVVLGLLVLPFAWASRPQASFTPAVRRAAFAWAVVVVAACVWELVNFIWGRVAPEQSSDHPSISDLLDPALDVVIWRGLFLVVWLGIGLLLVRPTVSRRLD
jgi:hypothetical protein